TRRHPARSVTTKRLSAPWGPASTRAITRRSVSQLCGGIAQFAVAADLAGLAVDPAERGILGETADPAQQHRIAGEAEDVADALALAPRHSLGAGVMAVAAHHDVDRRPAGADMANDVAQDQGHLGTVRRLAGAQRASVTGTPRIFQQHKLTGATGGKGPCQSRLRISGSTWVRTAVVSGDWMTMAP